MSIIVTVTESEHREILRYDDDGGAQSGDVEYRVIPNPTPESNLG